MVDPVVKRLAETRQAWGLTRTEVAKRIGIRRNTLAHLECGGKVPAYKVLKRWADVLGFEINLWPKESHR